MSKAQSGADKKRREKDDNMSSQAPGHAISSKIFSRTEPQLQ